MKYLFLGSPNFAAAILEKLLTADLPPVAVVCNPDRPVGRKKLITPPPVKELARRSHRKIEIFQPAKLSALSQELAALHPDLFIVAAYAKIIPDAILKIPRLGTIGVHPSLLPKYRGATPIQSALLQGAATTGVTLYQMDKKIDHGPVLAQEQITIAPNETYLSLEQKLAELAADLLLATIPDLLSEKIKPVAQQHSEATFTKKFETKDAEIDFVKDEPLAVFRKIQALNPEPGVYTMNFPGQEGKRVKLLEATFAGGQIHLTEIQVEGKKPRTL